jgi:hypothetical protein
LRADFERASTCWWQGKVETAREYRIDYKTAAALAERLTAHLKAVQSGRVVDAARKFRRDYAGSPTSPIVQEFDHQLYGTHF